MEEKLIGALGYCRTKLGWTVCIKDFYNLMLKTRGTSELMRCFINHENGYCSYIKSNPVAFSHCVEQGNRRLRDHIKKTEDSAKGFFGVCYCGVREFVMPIYYRDEPIGALILGSFRCGQERKESTFRRLTEEFGLEREPLETLYAEHLMKTPEEEPLIRHEAVLITACIELLCEKYFDPAEAETAIRRATVGTSRSAKLNHAILYIKNNLSSRITVRQVANACYCSESSISHLFKEAMGEGINSFILHERIAMAQRLILHSGDTMSEIAVKCGFVTNKYMTGVFKRHIGMTPTEFRNRNRDLQQ